MAEAALWNALAGYCMVEMRETGERTEWRRGTESNNGHSQHEIGINDIIKRLKEYG